MNFKSLRLSILIPLLFSACDSGEIQDPTDPVLFPDETAESLDGLAALDEINYTPFSGEDPVISTLVFVNDSQASSFNNVDFTYSKSGQYSCELEGTYDSPKSLEDALGITLNDPSVQGTRLRELLLRLDNDFTNAELVEIIDILNSPGAGLSIDPDDPLQVLSVADRLYTQVVTSTNADRAAGTQSGNYQITDVSYLVTFRKATVSETETYRSITTQHFMPVVTTSTQSTITETGRWVLSLSNE